MVGRTNCCTGSVKEEFYVYNSGTYNVKFTSLSLDAFSLNQSGYLYTYYYVSSGGETYTSRANSASINMTDYSKLKIYGHATTSGTSYGLVGIGQSNTSSTNTTYKKMVTLGTTDAWYELDLRDITGNQIISVGGNLVGKGNYKTYIKQLILV